MKVAVKKKAVKKIARTAKEKEDLEAIKNDLLILDKKRKQLLKKQEFLLTNSQQTVKNISAHVIKSLKATKEYKSFKAELVKICSAKVRVTIDVPMRAQPGFYLEFDCDYRYDIMGEVLDDSPEMVKFRKETEKAWIDWKARADSFVEAAITKAVNYLKLSEDVTKVQLADSLEEVMYRIFYDYI